MSVLLLRYLSKSWNKDMEKYKNQTSSSNKTYKDDYTIQMERKIAKIEARRSWNRYKYDKEQKRKAKRERMST